jgi:hypothetical protein
MTEREYIDATNLAKARAAASILSNLLPMTPKESKLTKLANQYARELEEHWSNIVATTE